MYFAIVLFSLIASSLAQIPGAGPCPHRETVPNFDPKAILGQWYGYSAYPDCQVLGRCKRDNHLDNNDGSMEILGKQLSNIPRYFGVAASWNRALYTDNGRYRITTPEDGPYYNGTLEFLETDYVNFVLKVACRNVASASLQYAWILTRMPNPPEDIVARINEAIVRHRIEPEFLIPSNHTNCPVTF